MKKLWRTSPLLTAAGVFLLALLPFFAAGILLDARIITGAPAWLKPAKFAASTGIYCLTMAWILTYLPSARRLRHTVAGITASTMVLEVAIIALQAARGTTSHYNVRTPVDATLFGIMGGAILIAWLAGIAVLVALFRTNIPDAGMRWALRLGLLFTTVGGLVGAIMVSYPSVQMDRQTLIRGTHTVGAPDGGAGMPGTGWSREHGDLRVAHFFGLHAIQILPLFAWLFGRNRASRVLIAGCIYAGFFAFTLVQALSGRPFLGGAL